VFEEEILDLFVPYMPMTDGKSIFYYKDLFRLGVYEMIWTAALLLVALFLYFNPAVMHGIEAIERAMTNTQGVFAGSVIAIVTSLILITSYIVLQQFPNSSDEYVYLYQGKTLSEGKLWETSHPLEKSFGFNHVAVKDGKMVGRFPPGWPLILALFISAGISTPLVNPLIAVLALLMFYVLANKRFGPVVAGWSLIALAFSGFFIFNSASFFSHGICLLAALIFVYASYRYHENNHVKYAIIAGSALGFLMITRYFTALLIFLPFFLLVLYQQRLRAFRLFFWIGIGALPFAAFLMWYNYSITGNPFQPVTVWAYQGEGLGFINEHTMLKGFEHIVRRFIMFAYWCSPVLLLLYFFFLYQKLTHRTARLVAPEDYFFLALVAGYLFYYEIGGNQYGPRFYYEALPFLILFVVRRIYSEKKYWAKTLLYAAIIIAVIKLPAIAMREHTVIEERLDVYRIVKQDNIDDAVIFLSSGTGAIRPMPSGDLTRNDIEFSNNVLYAIDHAHANESLMKYYKGRKFYKYVRVPGEKTGKLVRVR
jgi:hypothetical protein